MIPRLPPSGYGQRAVVSMKLTETILHHSIVCTEAVAPQLQEAHYTKIRQKFCVMLVCSEHMAAG